MKTFILATAVGLVAFAPSILPGSTAQTAQAQSAAMKACVSKIGAVSKTLNVSPKFLTRQRAGRTCGMNSMRPVLSSAEVLRDYVRTDKIGARKAGPKIVKACPGMVRRAVMASGAGAKAAGADNMKRACADAKGRPVLATAGYLSRMTAGVACVDKGMKSLRALRINAKPVNVQEACKKAKNHPMIAMRNYLARITKNAK